MEVIQTPKQVTIIAEAFSEVRRIYIGKPQASPDDVSTPATTAARSGIGTETRWWWTLSVSTPPIRRLPGDASQRTDAHLRANSPPLSTVLHDQITIDDPVVLEKPVTYTLVYALVPDYEMVEFVCDNNREYVDEKGVVRMRLAGRRR